MKKKRFYNDKKRNTKWTEPEQGRKIYFADKYIESDNGSDKFDNRRPKEKKPVFTRDRMLGFAKWLVAVAGCFVIISIGYTLMDIYIDRNAMPITENEIDADNGISNVSLRIKGCTIESLTMDNGVLLSAVIDNVQNNGYTGACFDIKRDDGTIGYSSALATVDMYGAQSSPASDAAGSVNNLIQNDILPIGRISCYKDTVFANSDLSAGILVDGELYQDSDGNAYLNPDSETVYDYIKGLVEEVKLMGVTVFVLDNCDLPSEISEGYNDGFDALSKKLSADFNGEVKFMQGVSITLTGTDEKEIEQEWTEKTQNTDNDNAVYYINTKNKEAVKALLNSRENINYIIIE